jgi:gas vesicle protein
MSNNNRGFWIALTIGAAAGAVAALLYAPQTGASTRKKLRRGIEDLGESLEQAGDYLKEQAERLSKETQRLLETSKGQLDEAYDSASGLVKSANKAVGKLI